MTLHCRLFGLTSLVVLSLFLWQGNIGFNMWDEGFLWYGAQQTMLNEVPIRDFMAYDPGRYYWLTALMRIWGDNGIMTLRAAVAIFQTIGLFVGLLLIAHTVRKQNFIYLLISAFILSIWMFPRHKLFDISLSILLIGVLAILLEKPTGRRYFIAGFCIGLVAFFGRNHGMYGVAGSFGSILWLSIKRAEGIGLVKGFAIWTGGVCVGFVPMLIMLALIPGFATAYWDSILFLFEVKATNLPLPIPWPWLVNFYTVPIGVAIRDVLVGLFFISFIVFGILSIVWVVWRKVQNENVSPALVAASFLTFPYAHYAYSRADVGHLAQGIFPLLIGILIVLGKQHPRIKWTLTLLLSTASLWVVCVLHPGWQCRASAQCVDIEISGNSLLVDPTTANDIRLLRKLADEYAPNGEQFIVTPFWPGAYPLLERKSPMWEIFALFPRTPTFEKIELERIGEKRIGFVFVINLPLDGRDELRFRNTHPLIHQYILASFEPVSESPNPAYQIYIAKGRNL